MPLTIRGIPDGSATFVFPDHPSHHVRGMIEVTIDEQALREAVLAGKEAKKTDELYEVIIHDRPEE